ncbi:hypothetical protein SDC9_115212 [bioreactor metagenome]|uniref:Uncharacterized protein n=1 Tax=bioreactor metagenome TaxID=1076179 RepID=A0A645BUI4_9ZZZZ
MRPQKIIFQVVVIKTGFDLIPGVDPVNVGQKQVAGLAHNRNIILDVQGHLKIILPVLTGVAVIGQQRVAVEDSQTVKISP